LFDLCVTTLLETWLRAKGQIGVTQLSKNDLIKILRPLAFWMHKNPTIGAIPEEELLEQIVRQLLERRIARYEDEAQRLAAQFLQIIHGKTGILIERGKHRYGFLHLTFEEYFAAWELVVWKKDREEFIKQHLHDPRWRVVILLAVGIVGIIQSDENGVTELVEEAILNARSPFERWLHRDLLLAGLCLADDVGVSIACEDAIIEQMIFIYLTSPYDSIRTSFSKVFNMWRGTVTAKKAVPLVLGLINPNGKLKEGEFSLSKTPTKFPVVFQLEKKLEAYRQHLVQQNRESSIRLIQLNIAIALSHLMDMTDMVEFILEALSDADSDVRETAAMALGLVGSGHPQAIEALLKALSDSNQNVREAIVRALGLLGSDHPQVVEALLKALCDADSDVQEASAAALAVLPIDSSVIGTSLEAMFLKYELMASKQFTADHLRREITNKDDHLL